MPTKQGQAKQDHNRPHHKDWPQIGPKITSKQGKNAKRTNGSRFTRPQYWVHEKQNKAGNVRLLKHINAGHLICLRILGRGRFSKHRNAGNSEDRYLHEVQSRLGS